MKVGQVQHTGQNFSVLRGGFARPSSALWVWAAWVALGLGSLAQARPVAIAGVQQSIAVGTRLLGGQEMLPVWSLPRLGLEVRNDPQDLRLRLGSRELRYAPGLGWRGVGVRLTQPLPGPQLAGASLYVPLTALKLLGTRIQADAPEVLDFAAPLNVPTATLPPSPDVTVSLSALPAPASMGVATFAPPAQTTLPVGSPAARQPAPTFGRMLNTVRINREVHRSVEVERIVLELSGAQPPQFEVRSGTAGTLTVRLADTGASPLSQTLAAGGRLEIGVDSAGSWVQLAGQGGRSEVFALTDPARVVIDTTVYVNRDVPPPPDLEALPAGVSYRQLGQLHLLSFDPAQFQAQVVSAPQGQFASVEQLVRQAGGVAGVNASYFDPASALPVDLVVRSGLMTAPSLEKRGAVGLLPGGSLIFGYPRPRYRLSGAFGELYANSVTPKPREGWLTAFVGDGQTSVGGADLLTLHTRPGVGQVLNVVSGVHVPSVGLLALTFNPAQFGQLPQRVGDALQVSLDWRTDDAPWPQVRDALSAGPLLLQAGRVVLDPRREGFNTSGSIWRPTRQVALGLLRGQPTIAYLEYGSPEAFAAALQKAGLSDALRLDSGSSATAFLTAGYGDFGGYLNTVWSRPVPNAIVFVPKAGQTTQR